MFRTVLVFLLLGSRFVLGGAGLRSIGADIVCSGRGLSSFAVPSLKLLLVARSVIRSLALIRRFLTCLVVTLLKCYAVVFSRLVLYQWMYAATVEPFN